MYEYVRGGAVRGLWSRREGSLRAEQRPMDATEGVNNLATGRATGGATAGGGGEGAGCALEPRPVSPWPGSVACMGDGPGAADQSTMRFPRTGVGVARAGSPALCDAVMGRGANDGAGPPLEARRIPGDKEGGCLAARAAAGPTSDATP